MAELASGAVSSLLGVIRNELTLLGRVRGDVQFIQEEMESMHSFLEHLARTVPPHGEHDPQVRTWMSQVRLLAQDCNNCIDLYLYRGNPDIHLASAGLRRYLLWVPWFVNKMIAQHRAADQLRELKERARDIGERRLRYSVDVPAKKAAGVGQQLPTRLSSLASAHTIGAVDDDDQEYDAIGGRNNHHQEMEMAAVTTIHPGPGPSLFVPPNLDDYFRSKLVVWMEKVKQGKTGAEVGSVPSIGIRIPDTDKDALALARDALAVAATQDYFESTILVDIPAVHLSYQPVKTWDVLYYILQRLERRANQSRSASGKAKDEEEQQQDPDNDDCWRDKRRRKWEIEENKWQLIIEIYSHHIIGIDVGGKIKKMVDKIQQAKGKRLTNLEQMKEIELEKEAIGMFLVWLQLKSSSDAEQDQGKHALAFYEYIITKTAEKLREALEQDKEDEPAEGLKEEDEPAAMDSKNKRIHLRQAQYAHILRNVFPMTSNSNTTPQAPERDIKTVAAVTGTAMPTVVLGEDQVKEIVEKVKLELVREVLLSRGALQDQAQEQEQERSSLPLAKQHKNTTASTHEGISESDILQQLQEKRSDKTGVPISDAAIQETINKMDQIRWAIQEELIATGIADKIKGDHMKGEKILIILKIDHDYDFQWKDIRDAIGRHLLGCVAGAVIVTASKNTQQAKKYCNPAEQESLDFSYAGQYHDAVLRVTRPQMHQDNKYSPWILREILDSCDSHEFCMKIFAYALYAKPKRTHEELHKLVSTLHQISEISLATIAKKMLKFSYNDLPKEYMTCLLYLAIFPPGYKIRRSTLIGRWVAEGLITTEEWSWHSSVQEAERCFDVLVNRWLIYPAAVGATGKVKSCIVGEQVHEFITKIAHKQRMVETRLSHHLARHFSVFNNLRLRASDTILDFFQKLPELSQYTQLKVLDLEGSQSFDGKNKRDLNNICRKILLLKYLSLRRTNVTRLPRDINKLHELEVLDIRQTKVPPSETRNVRLLKLKRFLAGSGSIDTNPSSAAGKVIVPSLGSNDTGISVRAEEFSISAQVPEKIEKMVDMEVLSAIEPHHSRDLQDIGLLWQLRKLGVVITMDSYLHDLFRAISNLHYCLRSLSITLHNTKCEDPHHRRDLQELNPSPKVLESLKSGTTQKRKLLYWLVKGRDQLTKVTLSNTSLSQHDLEALSELPMLRCLRLRQTEYTESKLTFKDGQFKKLKYFLVEGHSIKIGINFDEGTAVELEKIVLSLNVDLELCGLHKLQELKELELNKNDNTDATNATTNSLATTTTTTAATAEKYVPTTSEPSTSPSTTTTPTTPTVASTTTTNNDNTDATSATTNTLDTTTITNAITATAAAYIPTSSEPSTIPSAATKPTTPSVANTTTTATMATPAVPSAGKNTSSPKTDAPTINYATEATPATATAKKLFSLLDKVKQITKVTLHGTMLKKVDIQILAIRENLRSLVLLDKSYDESQLTLKNNEFPNLNILIVECSEITMIEFTDESCPKLDKIIWTFTKMDSLSGINNLPRLKELEFKGDFVLDDVKKAIGKHANRPYFTHYKPENGDEVPVNSLQKHGIRRSPFFSKRKSSCWRN